jgi:hypothetical protein
VSLQVQIMLVLSGHPNGRATLAEMNADLAVLAGAGPGWSQRIKRLAANAPGLDIFTEGYVVRDAAGWQITYAGRKALQRMDRAWPARTAATPTPTVAERPVIALVASGQPPVARPPTREIKIADRRRLPLRSV